MKLEMALAVPCERFMSDPFWTVGAAALNLFLMSFSRLPYLELKIALGFAKFGNVW